MIAEEKQNKKIALKICGMKYPENMQEISTLSPEYLGFIFYEKSPRNFDGDIPNISKEIKKTGVFVDASIDFISEKCLQYDFKVIQLHGQEAPEYCTELRKKIDPSIAIWKVFSVKDQFDFDRLTPYEGLVDAFLFDTKGKEKGGNGYTFDWTLLEGYNSPTPFILSGGIGLEEITAVKSFISSPWAEKLIAIDVNSKFEIQPGLKDIKQLKNFKSQLFSS